jgi:hypothetical protein
MGDFRAFGRPNTFYWSQPAPVNKSQKRGGPFKIASIQKPNTINNGAQQGQKVARGWKMAGFDKMLKFK